MKAIGLLGLAMMIMLIEVGYSAGGQTADEINRSLFQTVADNTVDKVKLLIAKGADVNARNAWRSDAKAADSD